MNAGPSRWNERTNRIRGQASVLPLGCGNSRREWTPASPTKLMEPAVDGLDELELALWRAAWRGASLTDSCLAVFRIMAIHLPRTTLWMRSFDAAHRAIETEITWPVDSPKPCPPRRSIVSASAWKSLLAWASRGEIMPGQGAAAFPDAALLVPRGSDDEVLLGPVGRTPPRGVVVAISPRTAPFEPSQIAVFQRALEPLATAVERAVLTQELGAFRNATEVERRVSQLASATAELRETIVGAETGLRNVMKRVELVSSSDVPILILGDTGTGKEVVARAIHIRSPRCEQPFIRVNCGAIPPELVDSQLFGHEKGSFTGAVDSRSGWFERANGGTLFLDEIGELTLAAQVRLLRVLQDGFIERVGGQQPIRVDVRIVAATHRDLAAMVKAGTFREDLWYRINVFPVLLPRLCERQEDIPALARHFAERAARRFGLSCVEPSPGDLQLLLSYSWPGNIRELGAVIDRAAILGEGKRLDVAKSLGLNRPIASAPSTEPTIYEVIPESSPRVAAVPDTADGMTLDEAMKHHIERALIATGGRIEGKHGAAALLAINPHTLRARMRKLGISWQDFRSARSS